MDEPARLLISEQLSTRYREALLLAAAGLADPQIAERLDLDPTATATLLTLARAKLRNALGNTTDNERSA